ncbi:MAG: ABC transporter permease [Oscillospiraceae bacterium]|nr:ABC transporter permease [Oscillospiraceae bacterium]
MANSGSEKKAPKKKSMFLETLQRTVKSPSAKLGAILFCLIVLAVIIGPYLSPYKIDQFDLLNTKAKPSAAHPFGTDALGRDILVRILYGGRYSLSLGILTALLGSAVGVVIGSVAGYFGGTTETIIMRIMDIWSSIPGMLLCLLISASLGTGFGNTILALAVGGVPGGVRLQRAQILRERGKEYLEAAESINCPKTKIMFKHLLPNVISPTIVNATMTIGMTITMAATLSYIGLGVQPPTPEWGAMLADGKADILYSPHIIAFPGLCIALTVLAINLLGDGLRDALDPRLRS